MECVVLEWCAMFVFKVADCLVTKLLLLRLGLRLINCEMLGWVDGICNRKHLNFNTHIATGEHIFKVFKKFGHLLQG